MHLEIGRNSVHLIFGIVLAFCILLFESDLVLPILAALIVLGLLVSEFSRRNVRFPVVQWFLDAFERKGVRPGKGVLAFFAGAFIALLFFSRGIVFVSILILSFCDSFSAMIGVFGRHRIYKKKTLEGFLAGFIAALIACVFLMPAQLAIILCFAAAVIELFAPIDDNLLMPPLVSLIMYGLQYFALF